MDLHQARRLDQLTHHVATLTRVADLLLSAERRRLATQQRNARTIYDADTFAELRELQAEADQLADELATVLRQEDFWHNPPTSSTEAGR